MLTWMPHGCSVGTDGQHGCHMDALWERTEAGWTLTWLPHGCFVRMGGGWVDVNMVATWMLCGNGRSLCGR